MCTYCVYLLRRDDVYTIAWAYYFRFVSFGLFGFAGKPDYGFDMYDNATINYSEGEILIVAMVMLVKLIRT